MNRKIKIILTHEITLIVIHALLINTFIEAAARHSFIEAAKFFLRSPEVFLHNTLIILLSFSVSLFFKRRFFVKTIISAIWIALGAINGIILSFRMTPFTVSDLSLLENGLAVLPNYMGVKGMIFTALGVITVIACIIVTFIFAPKVKKEISYKRTVITAVCLCLLVWGSTGLGLSRGWLSTYFSNLGTAYSEYGVTYCFINTWLNKGIKKPANYSEELVLNIVKDGLPRNIGKINKKIPEIAEKEIEIMPNFIFVQLESFIDPERLKGRKFNTDPVPNFHRLKENCSSGYLTMPVIGAGTANTETEVLTGMRLRSFGPGEYPYKSILKEKTTESINYVLKDLGYATHAIHNHRGAFYGRNIVFSKLGFDTFTSVEYMNRIQLTPKRWAKDDVLKSEIMQALNSTEGKDFVFAISVQGHGRYPSEKRIADKDLPVKLISDAKEADKNELEYYVAQVYDMDKLIDAITSALIEFPEPCVVVFYGDHLPVLNIDKNDIEGNDLFRTEYVIWSNFEMEKKDKDLHAYQLYPEVLKRFDIQNGVLTFFHQTYYDDKDYLQKLNILEYDMLYGKQYIFNGENPFKPTELQMGVVPIVVNEIFNFGENTYVVGENFTPYSKVAVNDKFVKTVFVNPKMLRVTEKVESVDPKDFSISQVGKYNTVMSTVQAALSEVE